MGRRAGIALSNMLTLSVSLAVTLAMVELGVRALGHAPFQVEHRSNEVVTMESDSVLGWRNKPGSYRYAAYVEGGDSIQLTLRPDGSRATGAPQNEEGPTVVFIGGSFTHGWAISDWETFPWKLQERFPSLRIENLGTPGWGTAQALLGLERRLGHAPTPDAVVYGLINAHIQRNSADGAWLANLARGAHRGHVAVPFARVDEHRDLTWHAPRSFPLWSPSSRSALIFMVNRFVVDWQTRSQTESAVETTKALIGSLVTTCEREGSACLIVSLYGDNSDLLEYAESLASPSLGLVDCHTEFDPALRVRGEGHPNGRANTFFADCIEPSLEDLLDRLSR